MMQKRIIRIAIVVGLILLIPLAMMFFSVEGWHWTFGDFIVMGALLFGTGLAIDFAARKLANPTHRVLAIIAIVAIFLLIWAGMVANAGERLIEKLFLGLSELIMIF
jgi:peptidoglycan/LPS O-acetylase OafA/YrhL